MKLMVSFVALLLTIVAFFYWIIADFGENTTTEGLQESIQTAVVANRDQSARVENGLYLLDRQGYEKGFKATLAASRGANIKDITDSQILFTYLMDPNGSKLNDIVYNYNGSKVANDYTKATSKFIAIKGARVLIDTNNNGSFTDKEDYVATVLIDNVKEGFNINGKGSIDGVSDGLPSPPSLFPR